MLPVHDCAAIGSVSGLRVWAPDRGSTRGIFNKWRCICWKRLRLSHVGCLPAGALPRPVSSASLGNGRSMSGLLGLSASRHTPATARAKCDTRGSTRASSPQTPTRVEIKVLSTLALMKAMRELVSRHEQLTGTIVTADFAPTNALLNRIRSGEAADIAILTAEAIDQLTGEGVLAPGSRVDLALSAVGLAVRAGAPRPEIGSVVTLKSALLEAESIAYSKIGASGVFFADLIQRLGIAKEVNAKARIIPSGFTAELVASGEAELAVQQVSELMMVPGIEVVARLPSEVQSVTTFSVGLFTGSAHREAATRLVEILSSRESIPILAASGLDPVARDRA